ncbi:hypothetical protein EEB13_17595 [Rhodococcus sp. WS3]|uniref:hypothetical protein n=1 Tax=Rhodococcus sp. WS3 TaxID=2486271 RepID=UPI0011445227|nr:hypothetical protein [Rhodococcus sp. WS3]ROZ46047.1 hypothetical protein EEB13_17595 [Rhodococcus sp. WS3]
MFLAQAEPVVHEVIIQSSTPWHIYIAALIAGAIAIGGWFVVHRTSQSRDLLSWRRTTLVQSAMELLEASNERFEAVNTPSTDKTTTNDLMRKITRQYETIRLIADDDLGDAARTIFDGHIYSANAISRIPTSIESEAMHQQRMHFISIYRMDEWELQGKHEDLITELKRIISAKKRRFGKSNHGEPENVDPDLTASSQINRAKVNKE